MTCVRRLVKDGQGNDQETKSDHSAAGSKRQESRSAKTGRKIRRSLRSFSKCTRDSCESTEVDEGYQTRSKSKEGEKTQSEKPDTTWSEQYTNVIEENDPDTEAVQVEPSEREMASNGKQVRPTAELEPIDVEVAAKANGVADVDEEIESRRNISGPEHEIEMTTANSSGDYEGASQKTNQCKNVDDPGKTDVTQESGELRSVDSAENDEAQFTSGEVSTAQNTPGVHGEDTRNTDGNHNTQTESYKDQATGTLADAAAAASDKEKDTSSEKNVELPVPGLCDAGMRTPQQVKHFKSCLRKAIQFVDVFHCKPPPGKRCVRGCEKKLLLKCSDNVPCRDQLCSNWHDTQAHRERCKNSLCEFKTRIQLRETMNKSANLDAELQLLKSQWEERSEELDVATTTSSQEQYTLDQVTALNDDIGQLERDIDDVNEKIDSLKDEKQVLLAMLSAIGINPQNDVADGFPDFETHYK
ncbi:hypothetical protein PC129_g4276 [Phytophthora cactorum]|uniref:Uncharacterized protein n=2 Tax=Phytophthora cactorum TaxID=29920 RepID=A0A329SKP1_9STRA|nr:hypothetical protein Pcac1_g19266 [Phytophthora cactorum]KAG2837806.1 hypothetical protein PC111_g4475 [Phytophthora cactorum]KAG2866536.1 hypothetical protein PC113_g2737 [Phytophthora cactorum]KAG2922769.1 hypothetical protein PC114_g5072 [Phytophthora cactorum]KAG2934839.1 hypothetical protein PC115_g5013 [Phytophthora cactorum]